MIEACYNSNTQTLKNKVLEWYPFPSGQEIYSYKGNFTWLKWLLSKNYYTTIKDKNKKTQNVVVSLSKELMTPTPQFVFEEIDVNFGTSKTNWGYDKEWLKPENNITTSLSATSQFKALFPPILESYQPAFVGKINNTYEIFFRLSNYTSFNDIAHVDIKVNLQSNGANVVNINNWPEEIIYKIKNKKNGQSDIKNYGNGLYSVKLYANASNKDEENKADLAYGHWSDNTYYKVQMRIGVEWTGWDNNEEYFKWRDEQEKNGKFSDWSTPMILKAISAPKLYFNNNEKMQSLSINQVITEFSTQPVFMVTYEQSDTAYSEPLEQYLFELYDEQNNLIESSNWKQYLDYSNKEITLSHYFDTILTPNKKYTAMVKVITKNLYETQATYNFKALALQEIEGITFPEELIFNAKTDQENGLIILQLEAGESLLGNKFTYNALVLTRAKTGNTQQEELYRIKH